MVIDVQITASRESNDLISVGFTINVQSPLPPPPASPPRRKKKKTLNFDIFDMGATIRKR